MEVIIIFGPQGCGKGTQASLLVKNLGVVHMSTGQLLRDEITKETELGKMANEIINLGNLVPDEVILKIIKDFLERNQNNKVLLDGFPRTIQQAEELFNILDSLNVSKIDVINIDIPREESVSRLLKRAETEGRKDDNRETINKRLNIYYEQTMPILNYLKDRKVSVHDIDGIGLVENIQEEILEKLENFI